MAAFNIEKVVAQLPGELEADTIYLVRVGSGFDIYVTNHGGTIVAYELNVGEGGGGGGEAAWNRTYLGADVVTGDAAAPINTGLVLPFRRNKTVEWRGRFILSTANGNTAARVGFGYNNVRTAWGTIKVLSPNGAGSDTTGNGGESVYVTPNTGSGSATANSPHTAWAEGICKFSDLAIAENDPSGFVTLVSETQGVNVTIWAASYIEWRELAL